MSKSLDLYEVHAKERSRLPDNWRAYKWECFPKGEEKCLYIEVTGAVCDAKKRNGYPNWRKMDKSTKRTVVLPISEHDSWCENWEKVNNKCNQCVGDGQVMASWSVTEGLKRRPCPKCEGTGKPLIREP